MMFGRLNRWIGKADSALGVPVFSDSTVERLRDLQQEQTDLTRRLAQKREAWRRMEGRNDPAAHLERSRLAPEVFELEARVSNLCRRVAEAEEAIRVTAAKAAEYAQTTSNTAAWLTQLLERLPSDSDLEHAFRCSRHLDAAAKELHERTGDRCFHRSAVDPHRALREALSNRLRLIERLHLVLRQRVQSDTKPAF
jgi:hypothetical protein